MCPVSTGGKEGGAQSQGRRGGIGRGSGAVRRGGRPTGLSSRFLSCAAIDEIIPSRSSFSASPSACATDECSAPGGAGGRGRRAGRHRTPLHVLRRRPEHLIPGACERALEVGPGDPRRLHARHAALSARRAARGARAMRVPQRVNGRGCRPIALRRRSPTHQWLGRSNPRSGKVRATRPQHGACGHA